MAYSYSFPLPSFSPSAPAAPGVLIVDLDALARNYRRVRDAAAPSECAAVLKADAYGLGLVPVARRLAREGCRRFFVASAAEGDELRRLLPQVRIYVLDGVAAGDEKLLLDAALTPVLNSLEQVERYRAAGGVAAILHVDTGMSRLGLDAAEIDAIARRPELLDGLVIEYVMTHLACADEPEHPLNADQLRRFDALRAKLPAARTSIANSAGVFLSPAHRGDLVRAGIGLFGGNPFVDRPSPVEPVVTLRARIVQVRDVAEATTVGYGATYVARPPCRLAVCGVGYADGYPRAVGNRCAASFNGRRLPVVGRVSMDLTCLDVSSVPPGEIGPGDYVELVGKETTLDEIAAAAGTISYEILTGFGKRLERRYEGDG
ncbi:MAG TPA: alanine racemase [Gammaproteobacteria bacterium]